jgi:PIN domain nuclease of toxin-antitoxin system
MKLLLDTHILIWCMTGDRILPARAKEKIENAKNVVLVSAVSLWEIAVKEALGRIKISQSELRQAILQSGFEQLPITFDHCEQLTSLPQIHRDPFDRMLVAQSKSEPAILVTHDKALGEYGDTVWVL